MKSLLILVALFGLTQAILSNSRFETAAATLQALKGLDLYGSVQQSYQRAIAGMATAHESLNFDVQALSVGCQSEVDSLKLLVSGVECRLPVYNLAAVQDLDRFCASNCSSRILAKIRSTSSACTTVADRAVFNDGTFIGAFRNAQMLANAVCTKSGSDYCITRLGAADAMVGLPTTEGLTTFCNPCTAILFKAIAPFADDMTLRASAYIELTCLKIGNSFCAVEILAITSKFAEAQAKQDFSILCIPCFKTFISKYVEIETAYGSAGNPLLAALASTAPIIKAMCTKDEFGQPCGRRLAAAEQIASSSKDTVCPDNPGPNTACPALCAAEVARFKAAMGCCFTSLFSVLGGAGGPSSVVSPARRLLQTGPPPPGPGSSNSSHDGGDSRAVIGWIENVCKVRLGGPCAGIKLKTKITLRNFRFAFYTANKREIDAKFRADVAMNLKCLSDAINVDGVSEAPATSAAGFVEMALAGVTFDLSILPEDQQQSTAIQAQLATKPVLDLPAISTLPLDSRDDPALPMTSDTSLSAVEVLYVPPDSASSLSISGFVIAVTAILSIVLA
jgi:hypothetical protein